MRDLIVGIALICSSFGLVLGCRPRHGIPLAFVKWPVVGPTVSILITAGLAIGVLFIAAYFTDIDVATLSG
jgi:hypothetical protein